jgi:hypothetical protein
MLLKVKLILEHSLVTQTIKMELIPAIPPSLYVNHAIQQDEDEEAGIMRMRIIMQNGNTGEHYELLD